ncbi:MAG: hypothetical protein KGQ93_12080 [Cyanobacteria bacterium REEB459]|nr:hypothetical protein [Cyanobacteria bacterium REEB459]
MIKPSDRPDSQPGRSGLQQSQPPWPELLTQAQALEVRLQQLQVGLQNLLALEQIGSPGATDTKLSQAQVANLHQAVDQLERQIAHHWMGWQYWRQPFWQALRYGGLGVLVGWGLAWLVYRG